MDPITSGSQTPTRGVTIDKLAISRAALDEHQFLFMLRPPCPSATKLIYSEAKAVTKLTENFTRMTIRVSDIVAAILCPEYQSCQICLVAGPRPFLSGSANLPLRLKRKKTIILNLRTPARNHDVGDST